MICRQASGNIQVVREDPKNKDLLYVGTEFGLYTSMDGGKKWQRFMNNLPTVRVDDILIHPRENDLIVATHGRSVWIADDITPLQQMTPQMRRTGCRALRDPPDRRVGQRPAARAAGRREEELHRRESVARRGDPLLPEGGRRGERWRLPMGADERSGRSPRQESPASTARCGILRRTRLRVRGPGREASPATGGAAAVAVVALARAPTS